MTCGVEGKTIDKNWEEETKKKGGEIIIRRPRVGFLKQIVIWMN